MGAISMKILRGVLLGLSIVGGAHVVYAIVDKADTLVREHALHNAAGANNIAEVRRRLDDVESPNDSSEPDHSALINLVRQGNAHMAAVLLESGADPNQLDMFGWTPLHYAVTARKPDLELIALLVRHGASVNVIGRDGRTPLHRAAMFGRAEDVKLLLALGAQADIRDEVGLTAWDLAASYPDVRTVLAGSGSQTQAAKD
jgi:ankyrin repeat protein